MHPKSQFEFFDSPKHGSSATSRGWVSKSRPKAGKLFLAFIFALAIGGGLWVFREKSPVNQRPMPIFAEAQSGSVEVSVVATGRLQPSRFVDVGAQVTGQLQSLLVEAGDKVQAGQLLAEIDAAVQANRAEASRASLQAQEAQMVAREAALTLAQANARRQARLLEENATTEAEFDAAMNALATAESSLVQLESTIQQSKARLASDEAQLGFTKIYAPQAGTVVEVKMKEGQTLNAAQQTPVLLRIANLESMDVEASVSEVDVSKIRPGMSAYFTTFGGGEKRWDGRLRQIMPLPVIENGVVRYTAVFEVSNRDGDLYPGMTAKVSFVVASKDSVVRVPSASVNLLDRIEELPKSIAIRGVSGNEFGSSLAPPQETDSLNLRQTLHPASEPTDRILVAASNSTDGDTVEIRKIRVGLDNRIWAEIMEGISAGERVVVGIRQ